MATKISVKLYSKHFNEIIEDCEYIVYRGTNKGLSIYESLRHIGVTIVPVLCPSELIETQGEFISTLRSFPEYVRNPANPDQDITGSPLIYCLGGFAALGNPASFHNLLVRSLRIKCRQSII